MLIPFDWLTEYVNSEGHSARDIAAKLTASGTSVERLQTVGEGLDDLIIAEVLEVYPHPNADRLRLAKVNTGAEVLEVVCGAPNLATGQHVVFAPVGASVPVDMHSDDRGPFTLTRAKIRGVESNGMICSIAELGLGEEHGGILVLPEDTQIGQSIPKALGYPRVVLDAEITTNRSDELSMVGVAREVSVLLDQELRLPKIKEHDAGAGQATAVGIESDACWRLMAQTLKVNVKPSPKWMQERLSLAGMRPINNVVDITNFVMLELGQPMHAYDKAKLSGDRIVARQAQAGETIVTLDSVTRKLEPETLIIADKEPIGVAGIMGGQASMIDESSTEIVLEAAAFDPVAVRKTANQLALRSEASRRFERGVDSELTELALYRSVDLLVEYADAKPVGGAQDVYNHRPEERTITLSSGKLDQYLGKEFNLDEAVKILERLGFKEVDDTSARRYGGMSDDTRNPRPETRSFVVPSWRLRDVEEEVDLIEEVVRMVGYDSLPVRLPAGEQPNVPLNHQYLATIATKRRLAEAGWTEVLTLSLTDGEVVRRRGGEDNLVLNQAQDADIQNSRLRTQDSAVAIANPLSSEWTHMRTSLLPGLLNVAGNNVRRQANLQLFELSKVYLRTHGLPDERYHLALALTGKRSAEALLMHVKGTIARALENLGVSAAHVEYRPGSENELLDERGSGAILVNGKQLGSIGRLSRPTQQRFGLDNTIVAELDIEDLLQKATARQFEPLPKFPAVEEDISLSIDEELPIGPIVELVAKTGGDMVAEVRVISVYRDAKLGNDKKSPLLHVVYRSADRTLSSQEIAGVRQQIVVALKREGIDVRD